MKIELKKIILVVLVLIIFFSLLVFILDFLSGPNDWYSLEDISQDLVKESYANKYVLNKARITTVFEEGDIMTSKKITKKVYALLPEQVCVLPGNYSDYFSKENIGTKLEYVSNSSREFKLAVYCATPEDRDSKLINELYSEVNEEWVKEQVPLCECMQNPELKEEICCVLFPMKLN